MPLDRADQVDQQWFEVSRPKNKKRKVPTEADEYSWGKHFQFQHYAFVRTSLKIQDIPRNYKRKIQDKVVREVVTHFQQHALAEEESIKRIQRIHQIQSGINLPRDVHVAVLFNQSNFEETKEEIDETYRRIDRLDSSFSLGDQINISNCKNVAQMMELVVKRVHKRLVRYDLEARWREQEIKFLTSKHDGTTSRRMDTRNRGKQPLWEDLMSPRLPKKNEIPSIPPSFSWAFQRFFSKCYPILKTQTIDEDHQLEQLNSLLQYERKQLFDESTACSKAADVEMILHKYLRLLEDSTRKLQVLRGILRTIRGYEEDENCVSSTEKLLFNYYVSIVRDFAHTLDRLKVDIVPNTIAHTNISERRLKYFLKIVENASGTLENDFFQWIKDHSEYTSIEFDYQNVNNKRVPYSVLTVKGVHDLKHVQLIEDFLREWNSSESQNLFPLYFLVDVNQSDTLSIHSWYDQPQFTWRRLVNVKFKFLSVDDWNMNHSFPIGSDFKVKKMKGMDGFKIKTQSSVDVFAAKVEHFFQQQIELIENIVHISPVWLQGCNLRRLLELLCKCQHVDSLAKILDLLLLKHFRNVPYSFLAIRELLQHVCRPNLKHINSTMLMRWIDDMQKQNFHQNELSVNLPILQESSVLNCGVSFKYYMTHVLPSSCMNDLQKQFEYLDYHLIDDELTDFVHARDAFVGSWRCLRLSLDLLELKFHPSELLETFTSVLDGNEAPFVIIDQNNRKKMKLGLIGGINEAILSCTSWDKLVALTRMWSNCCTPIDRHIDFVACNERSWKWKYKCLNKNLTTFADLLHQLQQEAPPGKIIPPEAVKEDIAFVFIQELMQNMMFQSAQFVKNRPLFCESMTVSSKIRTIPQEHPLKHLKYTKSLKMKWPKDTSTWKQEKAKKCVKKPNTFVDNKKKMNEKSTDGLTIKVEKLHSAGYALNKESKTMLPDITIHIETPISVKKEDTTSSKATEINSKQEDSNGKTKLDDFDSQSKWLNDLMEVYDIAQNCSRLNDKERRLLLGTLNDKQGSRFMDLLKDLHFIGLAPWYKR